MSKLRGRLPRPTTQTNVPSWTPSCFFTLLPLGRTPVGLLPRIGRAPICLSRSRLIRKGPSRLASSHVALGCPAKDPAPCTTCGVRALLLSARVGILLRPRSRPPTVGDSPGSRQVFRVMSRPALGGRSSWGYLSPAKPSPSGGISGTPLLLPHGCLGSSSHSASSSLLAAYRHPLIGVNKGGWARATLLTDLTWTPLSLL